MIINDTVINAMFTGMKASYTTAYLQAPSFAKEVAMTITSQSRDESYGWLGQFPQMREWIGDERVIRQLEAHGFTITNKKFESTISISRDDISDDRLGLFRPMVESMGYEAAMHPDHIVFGLLSAGFTTQCYDGQNFFDTDHQVLDENGPITGSDGRKYRTVSNMNVPAENPGPAWFLLDTSRPIKPIIWQEREKYEFQSVNNPGDFRVFMTDKFVYGVRARVNAGFGLWQMAYASRAPLNKANYEAARTAMQRQVFDKGRPLGIKPTVLVVPPELEGAAMRLLNTEHIDGGNSNEWKGTAKAIVTPFLGAA
jgi:phage major head subunit gpT-like protein